MTSASETDPLPPAGTVERWAWDLIHATELEAKLAPPPPPRAWENAPAARRVGAPGRPPELRVAAQGKRSARPGAARHVEGRARLCHTFLHHELQAAELLAWAVLAFPDTPRAYRAGLVAIARDELTHAALYRAHLGRLGHAFGDFPVRDWFWERVPACTTATQFGALFGMGLEGANLEHAPSWAGRFRDAGDEQGAALLERVAREEVAHVRFAAHWFEALSGEDSFEAWVAHLPPPLTPALFRGPRVRRDLRRRAGLSEDFVRALEAWPDAAPGS